MAETVRQVNTPPEILILIGVALMLGGAAQFRWWRGVAWWSRRFSLTRWSSDLFFGTDDAPKRGWVFAGAGFCVLCGVLVLIDGIANL